MSKDGLQLEGQELLNIEQLCQRKFNKINKILKGNWGVFLATIQFWLYFSHLLKKNSILFFNVKYSLLFWKITPKKI